MKADMSTRITTDSQNEILTEVDSNNKIIGPISRGVAHKSSGKIYRTIFVVVKNKMNQILLQKRSPTKDLYPNCWDISVGGHVGYGKSYIETAVKELEEELDVVASAKELKFIGEVLVKLSSSSEFFHVFEYKLKSNDEIKLNNDEVSDTLWMSIRQVKKSIQQKKLKWYPRPVQVIKVLY